MYKSKFRLNKIEYSILNKSIFFVFVLHIFQMVSSLNERIKIKNF